MFPGSLLRVATVFLYANSSRFQYISNIFLKFKYYILSAFSGKDRAEGTICNGQRSLLHTVRGLAGAVSPPPPAGLGQSPGGGPGGEGPGSTEDVAFYNIKNRVRVMLMASWGTLPKAFCKSNLAIDSFLPLFLASLTIDCSINVCP